MAPRIGGVRLVHEGWARYLVAEVVQADGQPDLFKLRR